MSDPPNPNGNDPPPPEEHESRQPGEWRESPVSEGPAPTEERRRRRTSLPEIHMTSPPNPLPSTAKRSILVLRESMIDTTASGTLTTGVTPEPAGQKLPFEIVYNQDDGIYKFYKRQSKGGGSGEMPAAEGFIYMVIPPDKGYAWFVLLTAFCCQLIADGIVLSIGILLPHIAGELCFNSKESALVASMQIGIYFISAPIGSAFINRFGFRPVAVTGAVIASCASLISSFSNSLLTLVLFYGCLVGPGMGMVGVCSSLIINYYFERYRAIVCGIVSSGSGVGIILISLVDISLVETVGWRYTIRAHFLLLALAGILCITYREVPPIKIGHYVEYVSDDSDESAQSVEITSTKYSAYRMTSVYNIQPSESVRNIEKRMNSYHEVPRKEHSCLSYLCPCRRRRHTPKMSDTKKFVISHDPLDRVDIFYDGAPKYVRTGSLDVEGGSDDSSRINEQRAQSINYTISMMRAPLDESRNRWCVSDQIASAFHALFDTQLLQLAEFQLLLAVALVCLLGSNVPFIFVTVRPRIDKKYIDVLHTTIGVTNIIFRLSMGLIAYKVRFHAAYLSGIGMALGGSVTLISGFYGEDSVVFQFFFAFSFGLACASFSAVRAIIYVRVVGLDKLTNAFGLTTMAMGVGAFCGTNIGGILRDSTSGYKVPFIYSGSCITTAGLLMLCVPCFTEYRRREDAKKAMRKVRFAKSKAGKRKSFARSFLFR